MKHLKYKKCQLIAYRLVYSLLLCSMIVFLFLDIYMGIKTIVYVVVLFIIIYDYCCWINNCFYIFWKV